MYVFVCMFSPSNLWAYASKPCSTHMHKGYKGYWQLLPFRYTLSLQVKQNVFFFHTTDCTFNMWNQRRPLRSLSWPLVLNDCVWKDDWLQFKSILFGFASSQPCDVTGQRSVVTSTHPFAKETLWKVAELPPHPGFFLFRCQTGALHQAAAEPLCHICLLTCVSQSVFLSLPFPILPSASHTPRPHPSPPSPVDLSGV